MNVGLAIECDNSIENYGLIPNELCSIIKDFFEKKDYGKDLKNLSIGLILMGSGSEIMHKKRPFKYEKKSSYNDIFTNKKVIVLNAASYDVKPDIIKFTQMDLNDARSFLVKELFDSTEILEKIVQNFLDLILVNLGKILQFVYHKINPD